jgi:hypothetical protein
MKSQASLRLFQAVRMRSLLRRLGEEVSTANNNKQNSVLYRHQLVDKGEVAY